MTADRLGELWGMVLWKSSSAIVHACDCMIRNDTFVFEAEKKNRVFKEGKNHMDGFNAWKQYDQSAYSRGAIGNKTAYAGHAGV
jgi:hypothetical protein